MNSRRHGLSVSSTPTLSPGMMSASFRPARVSMLMIAPSGRNSFSDCALTSSSMPAARNSSIVRRWKCAARGNGDPAAKSLDNERRHAVLREEHRRGETRRALRQR